MKKILSVLLVVCLLCAFSIAGSAVENDARVEEFVEQFAEAIVLTESYYINNDDYAITEDLVAKLLAELSKYEWFTDFDTLLAPGFLVENSENLSAYAADMKTANEALEQYIGWKGYTKIVDESAALTAYAKAILFLGEEKMSDEYIETHFGEEPFYAALDKRDEAYDYIASVALDPPADVQEKYDALIKPYTEFLNNMLLCNAGTHVCTDFVAVDENTHKSVCTFCNIGEITSEHTWGEYTENADGSKTAVCEFCDATNVIPGETVEPEENIFASLLEKIKSFFDAIIAFLQSIFNL